MASLDDVVTYLKSGVQALNRLSTTLQSIFPNAVSVYTVATLPASPSVGMMAAVTDGAAALAWGATVTGGGSARYVCWWNGSNWTVIGK